MREAGKDPRPSEKDRKEKTEREKKKKERKINESSEESFPASDPPSWTAG